MDGSGRVISPGPIRTTEAGSGVAMAIWVAVSARQAEPGSPGANGPQGRVYRENAGGDKRYAGTRVFINSVVQ